MLMKKALLIGLVLGLVAAWAVPAMAIDWSARGNITVIGHVQRNVATFGGTGTFPDEMGSYVAMRGDLSITARASEDLYGVLTFRADSMRWGEAAGGIGVWGSDVVAVEVDECFVDFRMPPKLPVWFRVGVQPFIVRPNVFFLSWGPGVTARIMIDPIKLMIRPMFAKLSDGSAWEAVTGTELYGVDASLPIGPVTPGAYFFYENLRVVGPNPDDTDLWWIGAYVNGKVGPVKGALDFIYNGGGIDNRTLADVDVSSWLLRGELSFVWNKLEVGAGGMYVAGEDTDTNDSEMFRYPAGLARFANTDTQVFTGGWMDTGPWLHPYLIQLPPTTFWPGFWDVRGFVYFQALDWLKVGAQVAYIGDTQSGTAAGMDALGSDADDDDSIGWELAFGTNVNIYKNLTLNTTFGYLMAGKALSQAGGVKPDDPWMLVSRLKYTF
jgi:hypothetical protein